MIGRICVLPYVDMVGRADVADVTDVAVVAVVAVVKDHKT